MQLAFKTILVPTDFGDASQLSLEYARVLAKRFDAGLRILHVVETPAPMGTELSLPDLTKENARALQDAQHRLAELMNQVTGDDVIGQVLVGHAATKIIEYAADHAVDLIVMGTHGRRALAHLLMGSVAERVIRGAPCPVFTVRDTKALRQGTTEHVSAAVS